MWTRHRMHGATTVTWLKKIGLGCCVALRCESTSLSCSFSLSLSIFISFFLSICLRLFPSFFLSVYLSLPLRLCLTVCLSLSLNVSDCLSVRCVSSLSLFPPDQQIISPVRKSCKQYISYAEMQRIKNFMYYQSWQQTESKPQYYWDKMKYFVILRTYQFTPPCGKTRVHIFTFNRELPRGEDH